MKPPVYSPYLAPNDFGLFPEKKSALRNEYFRILKTFKKYDNGTENYSRTGVPKIFPTVAASLGYALLKESTLEVTSFSNL